MSQPFHHFQLRAYQLPSLFLAFALGALHCAREKNSQDTDRDREQRDIERLQRAEGNFSGIATHDEEHFVPVDLGVKLLQNPDSGKDAPMLQVNLNVGLFGGVALTASKTSFDWKTGELNATFADGGDAPPTSSSLFSSSGTIELHAFLDNGSVQSAVLKAPQAGDFQLHVEKTDKSVMSSQKDEQFLFTAGGDSQAFLTAPTQEASGTMSLHRKENALTKSPTSDLPRLPGLEVSFRFFGLTGAPEVSKVVAYDPLAGTIEITLESGATVNFTNVFAELKDKKKVLELTEHPTFLGKLYFGSATRMDFIATAADSLSLSATTSPGRTYVGTYRGGPQGLVLNALAFLDDLGGVGQNEGNTAFRNFPNTRLRIVACLGTSAWKTYSLDLFYLDHVNRAARFRTTGGSSSSNDVIDMHFERTWHSMQGTFLAPSPGSAASTSEGATVNLQATAAAVNQGCSYFATEK